MYLLVAQSIPFSTDFDLIILNLGVVHSVLSVVLVAIEFFLCFASIQGAWDLFLLGGFDKGFYAMNEFLEGILICFFLVSGISGSVVCIL